MADKAASREVFSRRSVFIFAAIGSAVGLGNIWRFPYTAYANGGGAFLIPYVVALLTAGIPLLLFDYAIGHKYRASAPLAFKRFRGWAEPLGWLKTGVAFVIAVYYAVIIAWSAMFVWFSVKKSWGDNAETFFITDTLRRATEPGIGLEFVWPVAIVLALVWLAAIVVLALGVQKGIGLTATVFIPLLVVLFAIIVIRALFLEGSADGLNAFFTPNWDALSDPKVWLAAYGQIFFSLSVGFGIMITYSSYLKRKSDLTGSGLVVAFSNSAFEVLAGIGVFATLGFLAMQQGVEVGKAAGSGGIALAFITFPTILSNMAGGSIIGVLFFSCLVLAGFTSMVSILEVVIAAVKEKLAISRLPAVLLVGGIMTIISMLLLPTRTGLFALDILDKFSNHIGIAVCALTAVIIVDWISRQGLSLADHLNATSSIKVGPLWRISTVYLTPAVLAILVLQEIASLISDGYEDYPQYLLNIYGWGMLALIVVVAFMLSVVPWRPGVDTSGPPPGNGGLPPNVTEPSSPIAPALDGHTEGTSQS